MLRYGWSTLACLLAPFTVYAAPSEGLWIVVTAPAFRQTIEPLCEQRKSQGFRIVIAQTTDVLSRDEIRAGDGRNLRAHLNKLCRQHKGPAFVLLVGAIEAGHGADAVQCIVPPLVGDVGRMKGQPTDNGYGCLTDSRQPTVAVGRFPARNLEEARGMVAKTLEYERDTRPAPWRRRLTILAGIPAYNPLVDRVVEGMALSRLSRLSPLWTGRAIYTNPQSRFCVPEDVLDKQALKCVEKGEAFSLYLGHSNAGGLYGGRAHFLDRTDWAQLCIGRGKGVFFTFGCNGCQLRGADGEGYGVAAIRNPNGPVAVVGSHGICFASMVQLAAEGLFESTLTVRPPERLSISWLAIENGVSAGKIDDFTYRLLDAVDGNRAASQETQRQEHLQMFLLLGDPALRLPRVPEDVELAVQPSVVAGEKLTVRGTTPARLTGARVRLTLERTVDSEPDNLTPLPKAAGPERNRIMLANHERAIDFVLDSVECEAKAGQFQATLTVPTKLPWPRLLLRAYVCDERKEGIGMKKLDVKKQSPSLP